MEEIPEISNLGLTDLKSITIKQSNKIKELEDKIKTLEEKNKEYEKIFEEYQNKEKQKSLFFYESNILNAEEKKNYY